MNCITESQVNISANVLNIIAKVITSTSINSDPFTYPEAKDSPQLDDWNRAIEEECRCMLLNNTFTMINSRETRQLQVKPICSKWVYKTKHNPEGTIRYRARQGITSDEKTDFGETYATVGHLTTYWYLICIVGKYHWNIEHLNLAIAFLNPRVYNDDTDMAISRGWAEGLNTPTNIIGLKKSLNRLKEAQCLWHKDINNFLLSLEFTYSQAEHNHYLRIDGVLMLFYVDDISMLYPKDCINSAIEVTTRRLEKYNIPDLGPVRHVLGIAIHREENGTLIGISLVQKACITTILK
jgi:hypothetical protein